MSIRVTPRRSSAWRSDSLIVDGDDGPFEQIAIGAIAVGARRSALRALDARHQIAVLRLRDGASLDRR